MGVAGVVNEKDRHGIVANIRTVKVNVANAKGSCQRTGSEAGVANVTIEEWALRN